MNIRKTITIGGRTFSKPAQYPVTYPVFLRIIVGGCIKSADCKEAREKFYLDFLEWAWRSGEFFRLSYLCNLGDEMALAKVSNLKPTPPQLNELQKRKATMKLNEDQFIDAAKTFAFWADGLKHERAVRAADIRWGKKS